LATNVSELWLLDFVQSTKAKLTDADAHNAVWSADGTRVIFATNRGLSQLQLGAGAAPIALVPSLDRVLPMSPTSWSSDGQFLLYTPARDLSGADIWVLPLQKPADARPLTNTAGAEVQAQFSPEPGSPRWLAYTANGSGREEIFMRSFDNAGTVQLVSTAGGHSPRWRGDGRELFFVTPKGELMAARFAKDASRTETPVKLFAIPAGFTSRDATDVRAHAPWGATPDGQRFVFAVPAESTSRRQFTIILNWNSRAQSLNQ
jgi:Tol biopolymer transport system component